MSRTTGYAIVSGHKDRTLPVLCSPASRSWRALRPKRSSQPSCPKQPRKARHARNSRGEPRQLRDIVAWCLPDVARARTARGLRLRPLKQARRASLACLSGASRRAGGSARAQCAHVAQSERRGMLPLTAGARRRGPLRPPAPLARGLDEHLRDGSFASRRAGAAAPAQMAHLDRAERRLGSPPRAGARGSGPPIPPAAAARALSRRSKRGVRPEVL